MSDKFGDNCPCCGTAWKITTFGARVWKDCLKCEDKAENLMKKAESSSEKSPTNKYEGADWIKDWAEEYKYSNYSGSKYTGINSSGLDDDDDFDIPF